MNCEQSKKQEKQNENKRKQKKPKENDNKRDKHRQFTSTSRFTKDFMLEVSLTTLNKTNTSYTTVI